MRILIVKVSSLGDIIHTLPAVTDAAHARKDVVFDWVVEENFIEVPGWHRAVDKVIPVSLRRWRRNLLKTLRDRELREFRRRLRSEHYDLVIDAQGLVKSGIISRMSKGLTIGLSNQTAREPLSSLFYNRSYPVPWGDHAVERVRQLFARTLNYRYGEQVDYGIDLSRIGEELAPPGTGPVLFLHGTTWETKQWPDAYWRRLGELAVAAGYRILLPWGDERERRRAESIANGSDQVTVLASQSLTGIARHMLKASGMIAVDTGLGHLAAALGKPALTLYGATSPELTGTFGRQQLHLASDLQCAPCMKKACAYEGPALFDELPTGPLKVQPPCFATHKPEQVWHRFEQLVAG